MENFNRFLNVVYTRYNVSSINFLHVHCTNIHISIQGVNYGWAGESCYMEDRSSIILFIFLFFTNRAFLYYLLQRTNFPSVRFYVNGGRATQANLINGIIPVLTNRRKCQENQRFRYVTFPNNVFFDVSVKTLSFVCV